MVKTRQEITRIIERYKKELEKYKIHPEKVILYGSYAREDAREDSDIDLIVISKDFKKMNLRERLEILGLAAGNILEPIEALGYTPDEVLEKKETFLEAII
ncbi:MAG TPA: nucleotidyltransferase domain-containing protein [Atribacterota bacterium]|nr:nucleotidyltransferase domain-containing protein [Atribacterota bacterium]